MRLEHLDVQSDTASATAYQVCDTRCRLARGRLLLAERSPRRGANPSNSELDSDRWPL